MRGKYGVPYDGNQAVKAFLGSSDEIKKLLKWERLMADRPALEDQVKKLRANLRLEAKDDVIERAQRMLQENREAVVQGLAASIESDAVRGKDPLVFLRYQSALNPAVRQALGALLDSGLVLEAIDKAQFPDITKEKKSLQKKLSQAERDLEALDHKLRELQPQVYVAIGENHVREDMRHVFVQAWRHTQAKYKEPCYIHGVRLEQCKPYIQQAWEELGLKKHINRKGSEPVRVAFPGID